MADASLGNWAAFTSLFYHYTTPYTEMGIFSLFSTQNLHRALLHSADFFLCISRQC
jgi:hypothetical protein